jgi:hypothetical protein
MALDAGYCSMRRDLEENGWFLASRLSNLTSRLLILIGQDRQAFLEVKNQCAETRAELVQSHRRLQEHRHTHGC